MTERTLRGRNVTQLPIGTSFCGPYPGFTIRIPNCPIRLTCFSACGDRQIHLPRLACRLREPVKAQRSILGIDARSPNETTSFAIESADS